jgi:hypothetical protein
MKRTVCCCILTVFFVFWGTYSFAKFAVTPSVELKERYNDNIFLSGSDKEYDYITIITPKIKLEYSPDNRLELALNYLRDIRYYSRHSELNETNQKDTQDIEFMAHAKPLKYFVIDISDRYRRVAVDIRARIAPENELVNMTDSNTFSVSPYLTLPLSSTLSTTFGYKYDITWYRFEEMADYENHSAFLVLNKKISSKLNGGVKYEFYRYVTRQADIPSVLENYDSHRGSFIVDYQIMPKVKVNGEVGESWFDYKSGGDNPRFTFWNISADFISSEAMSLGARYGVSLSDSPTSGLFKNRRGDILLKTGKILKLTINPYYFVDKFLREDREDRVNGINVYIARPLTGKIDLALDGNWEKQKFLPEEEKVRIYSAGGGLDYLLFPKITVGIHYRYNKRNSTVDTEDFTNNIAWILAKVVF